MTAASGEFTLSTAGYDVSGSGYPLVTLGHAVQQRGFPLSVTGSQGTESLPLQGIPLYTAGSFGPATATLSLFVQAEPRPTQQNTLNLALHGTSTSGVFGGLPLVTYADQYARTVSGVFPLTVWHTASEIQTANMSLFAEGRYWTESNSLNLTAWAASGVAQGLHLYVAGSGTTAGAFPAEQSLFLYIERNPAANLDLFVQGPGTPGSGYVPLYAQGHESINHFVPLSIPNVLGGPTGTLKLYTHGF